jgi:hypothetical protein
MLTALECFWCPSGVNMTPGWKVRGTAGPLGCDTGGLEQVVMLASTTPIAAMDVDVPIDA